MTVTALDEFDNIDTNYLGTVHVTSSAPQAMLPGEYMFKEDDRGTHDFAVTFGKAGEWTVTASDVDRRSLKGSARVHVRPGKPAGKR